MRRKRYRDSRSRRTTFSVETTGVSAKTLMVFYDSTEGVFTQPCSGGDLHYKTHVLQCDRESEPWNKTHVLQRDCSRESEAGYFKTAARWEERGDMVPAETGEEQDPRRITTIQDLHLSLIESGLERRLEAIEEIITTILDGDVSVESSTVWERLVRKNRPPYKK